MFCALGFLLIVFICFMVCELHLDELGFLGDCFLGVSLVVFYLNSFRFLLELTVWVCYDWLYEI